MVEDLMANEVALARDLTDFFKVGHIEVAYAPGKDLLPIGCRPAICAMQNEAYLHCILQAFSLLLHSR
jgi:hypothetical protein